jgi:hypothetical protein
MAESNVQTAIMKLIKKRGGYVNNNTAGMHTAPGIADLTAGYKGLYIAIEVKKPEKATDVSAAQGIHCRLVQKAGCISMIGADVHEVEDLLNYIDKLVNMSPYDTYSIPAIIEHVGYLFTEKGYDDGTSY